MDDTVNGSLAPLQTPPLPAEALARINGAPKRRPPRLPFPLNKPDPLSKPQGPGAENQARLWLEWRREQPGELPAVLPPWVQPCARPELFDRALQSGLPPAVALEYGNNRRSDAEVAALQQAWLLRLPTTGPEPVAETAFPPTDQEAARDRASEAQRDPLPAEDLRIAGDTDRFSTAIRRG